MSKDTKKLIGLVAVGVIAWELWKRQQAQMVPDQGGIVPVNPMSPVPIWGQQLSASTSTEVTTSTESILDSLMMIPQGPGGTSNYPSMTGGGGFFGGAACILPPGA